MATPQEIQDDIAASAINPARVVIGNQEVDAVSIDQKIKAANFIGAQESASKNHRGVYYGTFKPGGCG